MRVFRHASPPPPSPACAYVRVRARARRTPEGRGLRDSGCGCSHGGRVAVSSPAAVRGVAGWEAQRLPHFPARLRWIPVLRPCSLPLGKHPPRAVPPAPRRRKRRAPHPHRARWTRRGWLPLGSPAPVGTRAAWLPLPRRPPLPSFLCWGHCPRVLASGPTCPALRPPHVPLGTLASPHPSPPSLNRAR